MFNKYFIPKAFSLLFTVVCCKTALGQNVGINSSGSAPDVSAGLDVNFSNKGLLIPRVTLTGTADISTIPNRTVSLLVYNSATAGTVPDNVVPGYYFWNGTKWVGLATGAANQWTTNGTTVHYNSGGVSIGNTSITVNSDRLFEVYGKTAVKSLTIDFMNDVASPSLVFGGGGSGEGLGSKRSGYGDNSFGLEFFTNFVSRMTVSNAGNIGIGTTSPHTSAALDVSATNKGLLVPNVKLSSTTLASPVSNPFKSLLIFNTETTGDVNPGYYYWNTTYWVRLGEGSSGQNSWTLNGTNIYKNNSGNVGVGNTAPSELFDVGGNSIFGKTSSSGRVRISNSDDPYNSATDIYITDDRTLRISNSGIETTGASLQLKSANENYLFSFEGKGGFRYNSRNSGIGESFKVFDSGSLKINTVPSTATTKAMEATGSTIGSYKINIQNQSSDAQASTDIKVTNNQGSETGGFIKMGIGSSSFTKPGVLSGNGTAYLYANAGKLAIGNSSYNNMISFFTNSTDGSSGGAEAVGTERIRIAAGGNVGVGNFDVGDWWAQTPEFKLTIDGHTEPKTTSAYDLGSSSLQWRTIYSQNALSTSDRRLKTNIISSNYGLKEVMNLQPVTYNWKSNPDSNKQVGLIAQDVRLLIPEAVKGDDSVENLSMNYNALVPVLINAIKEQQYQIEELKRQVKVLQK